MNTSIEGSAALGSGSSFDQGSLYTFTSPTFGQTVTAIQLFQREGEQVAHDLSFLYVDDEIISPGTYELSRPFGCLRSEQEDCSPGPFRLDSLFTADYVRQSSDSLFTYVGMGGTVTIETANEEVVAGEFSLSASQELAVARQDLQTFIESLHDADTAPVPPPMEFRELGSPIMIDGQFTATPNEFSGRVSHLNWMISGRQVEF